MAALVAVATFLIQIPIPATDGYLNFGDIMIFVSALTFGPVVGGFAGGVGSAISDVASGYASTYAPFTLIIKGSEGFIAGLISNRNKPKKQDIIGGCYRRSGDGVRILFSGVFRLSSGWAAL